MEMNREEGGGGEEGGGFFQFDTSQYTDFFKSFLKTYHRDDIKKIMLDDDPSSNFSVSIDYPELKNEDEVGIVDQLLEYSYDVLPLFDISLVDAQVDLQDEFAKEDILKGESDPNRPNNNNGPSIKYHCHVRLHNLPNNVLQLNKTNLPRSCDVEKFMEVRGTVIRTGTAKTQEYRKDYMCTHCKKTKTCYVEPEQMDQFKKPTMCGITNENHEECLGKHFEEVEGSADCRDYQEIKMQEQVHKLGMGSIPRSLIVILQDDLADKCQAGDDITVTGLVVRRWKGVWEGVRCDLEVVLLANHLSVNNEKKFGVNMTDELKVEFNQYWKSYEANPLVGRNNILTNICPGIHGMFTVKLALALSLIGGVPHVDPTHGTRVRGESHLLLVGEPGTGKSQYASKLGSRCVLTTGIGTTSAGLTVSAAKDQGGEWILEAGALVLADGGVCCIDEFCSIKERDRATIHEAMEQQTLSVAKHRLGGHQALWPLDKMQAYFSYIKTTLDPKLKPESQQILARYYRLQRRVGGANSARVTIRMFESLIRIAQAHARLMFRQEVEVQDAVIAVVMMESSMTASALLGLKNPLHATPPEAPDDEYVGIEKKVLDMLDLCDRSSRNHQSQVQAHDQDDEGESSGNYWTDVTTDLKRSQKRKGKEQNDADEDDDECESGVIYTGKTTNIAPSNFYGDISTDSIISNLIQSQSNNTTPNNFINNTGNTTLAPSNGTSLSNSNHSNSADHDDETDSLNELHLEDEDFASYSSFPTKTSLPSYQAPPQQLPQTQQHAPPTLPQNQLQHTPQHILFPLQQPAPPPQNISTLNQNKKDTKQKGKRADDTNDSSKLSKKLWGIYGKFRRDREKKKQQRASDEESEEEGDGSYEETNATSADWKKARNNGNENPKKRKSSADASQIPAQKETQSKAKKTTNNTKDGLEWDAFLFSSSDGGSNSSTNNKEDTRCDNVNNNKQDSNNRDDIPLSRLKKKKFVE